MILIRFYSRLSPFKRVIAALLLGICTGIVVGEPAGQLEIIGNVYIRLLQMTVLPYILVSIVGGLGRLDSQMAASIGFKALKIILFVWFSVMATLLLLPLAYPDWEMAGFFSTSLIAEAPELSFIDLYIPYNIFASLSNTVVPAVVLFSLLMGISVISVKNKDTLLLIATNMGDALMGVASFVAKLAPLGIFAIATAASGTLNLDELGRLQIFLWVYLLAAALLALVLLPLLIHWATPFSYRELLSVAGEAMVTAMATGTVLVVLPMIVERCKELLKKHNMDCDVTDSTVDVLVPTAYSFPSAGTLLGLGFILFSAWYVGTPLGVAQYPSYVVMGALTAFGSMAVAIPFLLDLFGLPADQFQLYLLGSVVTARFATALAALHGFVITLLVASAVLKQLKWNRMIQVVLGHLTITAGVMILAGISFTALIPYEYEGVKTFESMRSMELSVEVKKNNNPAPLSVSELAQPRLSVIRKRGTIRIGYSENKLPFVFRNDKSEVVGFDMELISELGHDIGLAIELVFIKENKILPIMAADGQVDISKKSNLGAQMLKDGRVDMIIGGQIVTPHRALSTSITKAYTHHTVGLVVLDARREEFSTVTDILAMKDLTLGLMKTSYYKKRLQALLPNARLVDIENPRSYFKNKMPKVDAFVFSAESGSAWTMLYPQYSVVVPKGMKLKAPVGFYLPQSQLEFTRFINTWLGLKEENGFLEQVYNYWILGENPKAKKPRWSVVRDVFGWEM